MASRKSELAKLVREFVFGLIEGEIEFDGMDAGFIASRCERTFETEYQNLLDNKEPDYGECAECTDQLQKHSSGNLYCPTCDEGGIDELLKQYNPLPEPPPKEPTWRDIYNKMLDDEYE